jgi:hypothetical protein
MIRSIAVTAVALFLATSVAAADRVQEGQWETNLTMGTGTPMVTKYCITPADARSMNGDEATVRKYLEDSTATATKGACTVKSVKVDKNQTVVAIVCGKTEVVNTTKYFGDRYESKSSNGALVAGKRLGVCPKS